MIRKLENKLHIAKFSLKSDSSEPQPEGVALEGETTTPKAVGFENQQDLSTGTPQDWRKQRLYSRRAHKVSYTGTQDKAETP